MMMMVVVVTNMFVGDRVSVVERQLVTSDDLGDSHT